MKVLAFGQPIFANQVKNEDFEESVNSKQSEENEGEEEFKDGESRCSFDFRVST